MRTKPKLKIIEASWHRNGISGMGFHAIIFEDLNEKRTMIASLFEEEGYCAVYDINLLAEKNIEFAMGNSWRGDYYEDDLRKLLKEYNENVKYANNFKRKEKFHGKCNTHFQVV